MSPGPGLGTALYGPPDMDNFRPQLEEAMALSAIYEDDFRVYSLQQQQQQQQPQQQESSVDKSPTTDAPAADACTAGSLGMEEVDPEALLAELDSAGPSDAAAPKTVPLLFEVMVHVELPPQGLQLRLPARGGSGSAAAKGGGDGGDGGGGGGGGAGADAGGVDTPGEGRTIAAGDPVVYLTPLRLEVALPPFYPSEAPTPQLSAVWLSKSQSQSLAVALVEEAGADGQVGYTWVEWLKASTLPHLGVNDSLLLPLEPSASSSVAALARQAAGPEDTALNIMRYSASRKHQAFRQEVWCCPICFDDVSGARCEQLPGCNHVFCTTCLSTHCRTLAVDGAVERVACPDPACRLPLPPHVLRAMLTEEEYERWEVLLLRKALDCMRDVVYCPRCNGICIEDSDHMAQCPGCLYVFCAKCFMSWHPTEDCLKPEEVLELRAAAVASKSIPEAVKRRREADLINQMKSLSVVKKTSKQCPGCGMAIDKFDGCNKVVCACGTLFCWKCKQIINGYEHFSAETCTIFDDAEVQRWRIMEQDAPGHPQLRAMAAQPQLRAARAAVRVGGGRPPACPLCGQWNVKENGNNNIRCWSCGNNFCGLCREVLRKGKAGTHFSPSGCKQHTYD